MSKGVEKFKLIALLGTNQDKSDCLKDISESSDLMEIYEYLSENNNYQDCSFVSDGSLKREIINHLHIDYNSLKIIFEKEKCSDLKELAFQKYVVMYPYILDPHFSLTMLDNLRLVKRNESIWGLGLSWFIFFISFVAALMTPLWFLPLGAILLLNGLWWLSGGFASAKFDDFIMYTMAIIFSPIWVPLLFCFFVCFFSGIYYHSYNTRYFPYL